VPPALPHVFSNIAPDQFATLAQEANAAGITLAGNSGTASKFSVEVSLNYSPEACQITIQCLDTPFFVSPETVYAKIKALIQETVGS
jgi:hypothetical protein